MIFDEFGSRKKRRRKLLDIDVEEISLVDKAAIGKIFYITKRAEDLAEKVENFIPEDDEDKETLKAIASSLPEKEQPEFIEQIDTMLEYRDVLTPDLCGASTALVGMALGSAAIGPDEESAAVLAKIKKVFAKYKDDFNEEVEKSIAYFEKMAAEGLEGAEYPDPEEDLEDPEEGGGYVSKYAPDHRPGDPVEESEEIRLAKSKKTNWPSFQIAEEDTKPGVLFGREFIGKSKFLPADEDPEEGGDKAEIRKLEAEIKKLKGPIKKGIEGQEGLDMETLKKDEDEGGEFVWSSLVSG